MIVREVVWRDGKSVAIDRKIDLQCTPAQMRLALHRAGLLATVQAIADSDAEASIVWEYATVIVRNSPFIDTLKSQSGMTDTEIDALFVTAAAI